MAVTSRASPFDFSSHICSFFAFIHPDGVCIGVYERNDANALSTCRLDILIGILLLIKRRNSAPTALPSFSTGLRFSSTRRYDYSRLHLLCSLYAQDLLNTFLFLSLFHTLTHNTHFRPQNTRNKLYSLSRFSARRYGTFDEVGVAITHVHSITHYTLCTMRWRKAPHSRSRLIIHYLHTRVCTRAPCVNSRLNCADLGGVKRFHSGSASVFTHPPPLSLFFEVCPSSRLSFADDVLCEAFLAKKK